tara:strand:+ start:76 stop:801 length:726 start_codon:yes stop_codon:yes gene_type:complete
MTNIFRNIRKLKLNEKSLISYIKYGFGEIILVVIGILIAVQLNNLNNKRIEKKEEAIIIKSIKSDLESNLKVIEETIDYNQYTINQYQKIENYILNNLAYNKELEVSFGYLRLWSSPYLRSTTYNSVKSKGIDLISNTHLKEKISQLYDNQLSKLLNDYDRVEWEFNQNVVNPFFVKHFRYNIKKSLNEATANNYDKLKIDDEFLNILSVLIRTRKKGIQHCNETIYLMKDLINDIDSFFN